MKKIVRYSIPNIFTAASLFAGFLRNHHKSLWEYRQAAWMIVWWYLRCMDGLLPDCESNSPFGAEFDSMADLVSFGVALDSDDVCSNADRKHENT